jgi:butyryl-CoA dehydrogenase
MASILSERDLAFHLYELLDTEALLRRERYADLSREVFDATLDTARRIAEQRFAPHLARGDAHEPTFDGTAVTLIPETKLAWDAFAEAGFLNAHWDADEGGLQLPGVVHAAAVTWFNAANVATTAYSWLTVGAANLLRTFGTAELKARFLAPMGDGRCAGTMALTEPAQGSALGDIRTAAEPQPDGTYRLCGQKMFISGGDHGLTENIVHMVLARISGAPAGVKGISLFLVPKVLVNADGTLGGRNDVALAGLLHKMGWRNTTSTVLSFGEKGGAVGYLLGEAGKGLAHMFQMMNEARINIGLCAAAIACRGYLLALDYARSRAQGRLPSCKDPATAQVKLIEHADVRRLLLAQKAYAEGALAMSLYGASLAEDRHTHADPAAREAAALLLDILTPVIKSWPSRYGCVANDHAIQVLGGSGYTRDYVAEQLYRDQRLNPIHEGAEAIHALDLLGRKTVMQGGAAYRVFRAAVDAALAEASREPAVQRLAAAFLAPLARLDAVTAQLAALLATDPDRALANAGVYLDAFGRIVAAWVWLKQALAAERGLSRRPADADFYRGKLQAARYYISWELPATLPQFDLLAGLDSVPLDMRDEWF